MLIHILNMIDHYFLCLITGASAVPATVAANIRERPTSAFGKSDDASSTSMQQPPADDNNSFVAIMALLNNLDSSQLQRVQARCQELID
jgi:hypothetical protein